MSGDFQHVPIHATRPSTLHSKVSLIPGIATDRSVGRWGQEVSAAGWTTDKIRERVRLRLNPGRSGLSLAKQVVYGTEQIGGDHRFREQPVNPNAIRLGHRVEVHSRESNDLRVRAKLPYESKRLVAIKSWHVVIE